MGTTRLGTCLWNEDSRQLLRAGSVLELTALETRLLAYLAARARQTVDSEELLREVWAYAPKVRTRAVASTVTRLRTKLGEDGASIVTVYGRGYRLEPAGEPDLVGRTPLLARIRQILEAERRVTLYGLGGVGKTRAAQALREQGGWRSAWVPCEALRTEGEVWAGIAAALDLEETADERQVRLALDAVGPALLVLDGVEHLASIDRIASSCSEWCPQLHVVMTSRVHHGAGPAVLVEPLEPGAAMELFARLVHRADPDRALDPDALRAVVDRVEGLPLGIELAAARTRLFDLPALAEQLLADPLVVDQPSGSLSAVLGRSWELLDAHEQRALAAAAQFPESFTLDQVQEVSALATRELLAAMEGLVRAALVLDRHPRFRLLPLVRDFAASRADPGCVRAFVDWATRAAEAQFRAHAQGRPMLRDAPGYPLTAIDACLRQATDPTDRAWLVLGLFAHEERSGSPGSIKPRLDDLELEELGDEIAAAVLHARARAAQHRQAWSEAAASALAGRQRTSRTRHLRWHLDCWSAQLVARLADRVPAEDLVDETAALELAVDPCNGLDAANARALHVCGRVALNAGQLPRAFDLLQRARALAEADLDTELRVSATLGFVYRQMGRLDHAIDTLRTAWDLAEQHDIGSSRVDVGLQLADMLHASGDQERAAAVYGEVEAFGRRWGIASVMFTARSYAAIREPDDVLREAELLRVAQLAARVNSFEEAGGTTINLGYSRHARGALAHAVEAYDEGLRMLRGDRSTALFSDLVGQCWRALALAEAGHPPPDLSFERARSQLADDLAALVEAALASDWETVDRLMAEQTDQTLLNTAALVQRLRP